MVNTLRVFGATCHFKPLWQFATCQNARVLQVGVLFESLMATIVRGAGQESKHVRQAAAQAAVAVMQHSHDLQVQAATCQRVAVAHADQVTNMCAVLGMFQLIIAGNDMRYATALLHMLTCDHMLHRDMPPRACFVQLFLPSCHNIGLLAHGYGVIPCCKKQHMSILSA